MNSPTRPIRLYVRAWLARIEALPGFVPMRRTPLQWVA